MARRLRRLKPVEYLVEAAQGVAELHLFGERGDRAHVGEVVVVGVELPDVLGLHLADGRGPAARREGQRVFGPVEHLVLGAEEEADGAVIRRRHLLVDRALLFEPQRLVGGVLADAPVAHLAAYLLVRVVGVEERVHLALEELVEDVGAGGGVELVAGAPLLREGGRDGERHAFEAGVRAPDVALAEEQVLLRVRLAALGDGERVDPREDLRHGLNLKEVEREAGARVAQASAEGPVGVVQIHGLGAEAVDDLAFSQRLERDVVSLLRLLRRRESRRPAGENRKRQKQQKQSGGAFPVHKKLLSKGKPHARRAPGHARV